MIAKPSKQARCDRAARMRALLWLAGVIAIGILVFSLMSSLEVEAKTLTVNDNGGADHTKIQDAIDSADDGDAIRVYAGSYYENIVVNKRLDIIGNGSANTTIHCFNSDAGVTITADWANLSGFRVKRTFWSNPMEASIRVESENSTIFENNCSGTEYGIYLRRSDQNILFNNTCVTNDYGIYLYSSHNNTLRNNSCSSNNEAGIKLRYSTLNTLINNHFVDNDYGIYLYSSWNNTLIRNLCESNREIGVNFRFSSRNIMIDSSTTQSEFGIYFHTSWNNSILDSTITNNMIGIHLNNSNNNSIHNSLISNNAEYGINANNNDCSCLNATDNDWGDPSGPYHPLDNPEGSGDNVTDLVEFDPWIGSGTDSSPTAHIAFISPNPSIVGQRVDFIAKETVNSNIERYLWNSSIDGIIYNNTYSTFSYKNLTLGNHTISLKVRNDQGIWSQEVYTNVSVLPVPIYNQPPLLTILSPNNNSELSGIITLSGKTEDPEGNSAYVEMNVNDGDWQRIANDSLWNYKFETSALKRGACVILFRAFDGQNYSDPQTLYLILTDDKDDNEDRFVVPPPSSPGFIMICFFGLLGIAYLRENVRYTLHSFLTIPLYTKIKKDDVLNHANRLTIFRYLTSNPGANYTRLKKELNFGTSTLVYHLTVLEREEIIRSKKKIGKRMFYPKDPLWNSNNGMVEHLTSPVQNRIFNYLKDNGPTSMRDIEKALSLKQQSVSYNIRRLVERELITTSGKKRNALYKTFEDTNDRKIIDDINYLGVMK